MNFRFKTIQRQTMTNGDLEKKIRVIYDEIKTKKMAGFFQSWISHHKEIFPETDRNNMTRTGMGDVLDDLEKNPSNPASKKDLQYYKTLKSDFDALLEWIPTIKEYIKSKKSLPKKTTSYEQKFWGTKWYAYLFDNQFKIPVKLGRVTIEINDQGSVTLKNMVNEKSEKKYEGHFRLLEQRYAIFELRGTINKEKPLYIETIMGMTPPEVSLGSYIITERDTIVSGTMILHLIKNENTFSESDLKPLSFRDKETQKEFMLVSEYIKSFLSKKQNNYNKIPTGVYSIENLKTHISQYKRNKKNLFFDEEKSIVFIASPAHSISQVDFEKNKKDISDLKIKLKKEIGEFVKFKFPSGQKKPLARKSRFLNNLNLISKTHLFVLIYLDSNTSSPLNASAALLELGWAMAFSKAILIFYDNENIMPSIVPSLNGVEDFKAVHIPSSADTFEFIYTELLSELYFHLKLGLDQEE